MKFRANIKYGPETVINCFDTVYKIVGLDREAGTVTLWNVEHYSIREPHEIKVKLDTQQAKEFDWDMNLEQHNRFIWVREEFDDYFKTASEHDLQIATLRKMNYDLYKAYQDTADMLTYVLGKEEAINMDFGELLYRNRKNSEKIGRVYKRFKEVYHG